MKQLVILLLSPSTSYDVINHEIFTSTDFMAFLERKIALCIDSCKKESIAILYDNFIFKIDRISHINYVVSNIIAQSIIK